MTRKALPCPWGGSSIRRGVGKTSTQTDGWRDASSMKRSMMMIFVLFVTLQHLGIIVSTFVRTSHIASSKSIFVFCFLKVQYCTYIISHDLVFYRMMTSTCGSTPLNAVKSTDCPSNSIFKNTKLFYEIMLLFHTQQDVMTATKYQICVRHKLRPSYQRFSRSTRVAV